MSKLCPTLHNFNFWWWDLGIDILNMFSKWFQCAVGVENHCDNATHTSPVLLSALSPCTCQKLTCKKLQWHILIYIYHWMYLDYWIKFNFCTDLSCQGFREYISRIKTLILWEIVHLVRIYICGFYGQKRHSHSTTECTPHENGHADSNFPHWVSCEAHLEGT